MESVALVKWVWDLSGKDPEVRGRALTGEEDIVGEARSSIKNVPLEQPVIMLPRNLMSFPPGPVGCSAKVLGGYLL